MKDDFEIRFNNLITRLHDLNLKIINYISADPVSVRKNEYLKVEPPAFAEELDFYSLNEWMSARDNSRSGNHEY
jgi:hypothetical protein